MSGPFIAWLSTRPGHPTVVGNSYRSLPPHRGFRLSCGIRRSRPFCGRAYFAPAKAVADVLPSICGGAVDCQLACGTAGHHTMITRGLPPRNVCVPFVAPVFTLPVMAALLTLPSTMYARPFVTYDSVMVVWSIVS